MIQLKTKEDIEYLAKGGGILAGIIDEMEKMAVPGVSGVQLDERARELMAEAGVLPAFLNYAGGGHDPYPAALCISVNDAVVHGLPTEEPFVEGDIVGIDAGLIYEGKYFLDSARTVAIGEVSAELKNLLNVTKRALEIGIEAAGLGNKTGDIGNAVQSYVEREGLEVVRQLVGHGVGFGVHEEPPVPNYGKSGRGHELQEGLVIAIEPMVTIGDATVATGSDGWTVETKSGNASSHFEHTVAITAAGPRILTLAT